ncbi:MAG: hypothetical protein ACQEV7_00775 [Bacillota bacterium]
MRNTRNFILLLMTILPWLTAPFIGNKSFKRFLPGTIFMCLYVTAEGVLAEKRKWWWFPFAIRPNVLGEMPLILGPFFVGSIWILKYTFGNFKLYMKVNIVIDTIFTYFMLDWFKKIGYVTLVRFSKFQLSLLFLVKSILMYGFQAIFEKYSPPPHASSSEKETIK